MASKKLPKVSDKEKALAKEIKRIDKLVAKYIKEGYTIESRYREGYNQWKRPKTVAAAKKITAKKIRTHLKYYDPTTGKKQTWSQHHTETLRKNREHPKTPKDKAEKNSIIDKVRDELRRVPDTHYVQGGVAVDTGSWRDELLDMLRDYEDDDQAQEYLVSRETELLRDIAGMHSESTQEDCQFWFDHAQSILVGRPLTLEEKIRTDEAMEQGIDGGIDPELLE